MRVLRFQIRHHTGQVEQVNVEGERALVGSGAHCDIRLPLDQARVEHVLVEAASAGLFVRALSFEPPPTLNSIPFQQSPLPPGAILGITGCQIVVELSEGAAGGEAGAVKAKKKSGSLRRSVMWIAMAPMLYFLAMDSDTGAEKAPPPSSSPDLWAAPITACPYSGAQATAFARERMALADAKRERRPFHVQDGIEAVPVYEVAGACFRSGADPASAGLAEESAKYLRQEMSDEFRTRRVRLEHALSVQDDVSALKEIRVLLQLTEGKSGEYVEWLVRMNRNVRARVSAAKKR